MKEDETDSYIHLLFKMIMSAIPGKHESFQICFLRSIYCLVDQTLLPSQNQIHSRNVNGIIDIHIRNCLKMIIILDIFLSYIYQRFDSVNNVKQLASEKSNLK